MGESQPFEPVIVGFLCNWCSYRGADMAGTGRMKYAPNLRIIRVMCSGRVEPEFVFKALASGADAVLIAGCHPGDCHYIEQNYKTMRRYALIRRTLPALGIEAQRVQLLWASASEGARLAEFVNRMTAEVRALGPLNWRQVAWSEDVQAQMQMHAELAAAEGSPA
jgi:F420-non-reducing hydrogenase iron-sulfur subunit